MRTLRGALGALAALAAAAYLLLGGVGPAPLRALDPLPLPSIDLGSPLPSVDLGSPLPSVDLGSPLPSIDLGSPLPSIDLGSPLPSIPPVSVPPGASSPTASPVATSTEPAGHGPLAPSSSIPAGDLLLPGVGRSPTPGTGATTEDVGGVVGGRPSIPELAPLTPTLPDAGSWLVPLIGVAVPALIVALIVAVQVIGGAVGLRLARGALDRIASVKPAWMRS